MPAVGVLLAAAALAAAAPAAPYPRPGDPGYNVAKAFTAIVQDDEEVNLQDPSQAFGLPELPHALTWQGPLGSWEEPRFSAFYHPPHSAVGITSILIVWHFGTLPSLNGKWAASLELSIFLRPDACVSEAEMAAATGVPVSNALVPGYDGGRSGVIKWFAMPDGNGRSKSVQYLSGGCRLSAVYTREI